MLMRNISMFMKNVAMLMRNISMFMKNVAMLMRNIAILMRNIAMLMKNIAMLMRIITDIIYRYIAVPIQMRYKIISWGVGAVYAHWCQLKKIKPKFVGCKRQSQG